MAQPTPENKDFINPVGRPLRKNSVSRALQINSVADDNHYVLQPFYANDSQ